MAAPHVSLQCGTYGLENLVHAVTKSNDDDVFFSAIYYKMTADLYFYLYIYIRFKMTRNFPIGIYDSISENIYSKPSKAGQLNKVRREAFTNFLLGKLIYY